MPRGPSTTPILLVVAAAGAGTMTVELSAVRLLAPWFGTSAGVWTNVIGVILLALALGYLVGARLSSSGRPGARLGWTLFVAALFTAILPGLARPVAEAFVPAGLALDETAELMTWGSLAAALILFLPAAAALGCVGPLAVELVQRSRGGHAGDAGGRVLAASTLGSLVGTFGTTHVFLPRLGLERAFQGAALVLVLAGLCVYWLERRSARSRAADLGAAASTLAVLATLGLARLAPPDVAEGVVVLAERQSPYQAIQVLETGAGEQQLRRLVVNERVDSFQSVWQPEAGLLPSGYYYNLFALPPWWARAAGDGGSPWRLLVLGLGAGTTVRVMEGCLPEGMQLESTGAEIDRAVIDLAQRWFDLEDDGTTRRVAAGLDARAALRAVAPEAAEGVRSHVGYDQIVLDTYANNMEIPAHLCSREFFVELRAALAPGGWVSVNAAGFGLDDPVVAAVAQTLAEGFDAPVLALRVPFSRNCVVYARRGAALPLPGTPGFRIEGGAPAQLIPALEVPGAWTLFEPGAGKGRVLTDDKNPIDRLQLQSIAAGRRRWQS